MKILLSWLLDYLDSSIDRIDVDSLVHLFNTRTAEIESFERVTCSVEQMILGKVTSVDVKGVSIFCPERALSLQVAFRSDCVVGKTYLLFGDNTAWRWVALSDFSEQKEGLFPAVHVSDQESLDGSWKNKISRVDYILDVDNKSINHRPDLWGHYGIAREVAAFLGLKLKPMADVLAGVSVVDADKKSIEVVDEQGCLRFAIMHAHGVNYFDVIPWMAIRLLRVDGKPVSSVVDITNYVMFDIGHPMHGFDSAKVSVNVPVVVRKAKPLETLTVLDGQTLKLTDQDLIVASGGVPVSLAGIMGGRQSGFQADTRSVTLEAAGFDSTMIRKTAQHFKIRTEASIRFEKQIDSMGNIAALQRFAFIAYQSALISGERLSILSAGKTFTPSLISIDHGTIERKIGEPMSIEFIKKTLVSLGFEVLISGSAYQIMVPTYRATKDIKIQEDILEEIVRFYGFENISQQLPVRYMEPFSSQAIDGIEKIKNYLAFCLGLHEMRDYLLYDQSFVSRLGLELGNAIVIKNPLSQNWTTLVTSLVPHLLKGVDVNMANGDHVRLFEHNRIWSKKDNELIERTSMAGIIFDKKAVSFYDIKREMQGLWDLLAFDVIWRKPSAKLAKWYDPYMAAELLVGDRLIGYAGMMSQEWMHPITAGSAFVFELDCESLALIPASSKKFKMWSKFQDVSYDLSLLIPMHVTVDQIKKDILRAHPLIVDVSLIDFFEKEEWLNQRSVTLRYVISNHDKTMTKQELEEIVQFVLEVIKKHDAIVR